MNDKHRLQKTLYPFLYLSFLFLVGATQVQAQEFSLPELEIHPQKKYGEYSVSQGKLRAKAGGLPGYEREGALELDFHFLQSSTSQTPQPLLVILPPIGGVTPVEWNVGTYFAKRNYNIVIAKVDEDISDETRPIADINSFLQRQTSKVRVLIQALIQKEMIDPERIAVFGVSLGGIRGSILLGREPLIKAASFIVAGGDLAEVISFAAEKKIRNYRKHRIIAENLSGQWELFERLKPSLTEDPMLLLDSTFRDKVFLLISRNDDIVPTYNQFKLWQILGEPQYETIGLGHYGAAALHFLYLEKIEKFFSEKLEIQ